MTGPCDFREADVAAADAIATEDDRLRGAIIDLLGVRPLTYHQLAAGVREEWGPTTPAKLRALLRGLVRDYVVVLETVTVNGVERLGYGLHDK